MTQTIERPRPTAESESAFRLDLNKIDVSERLPETSSFELRRTVPTTERPAVVYMAVPKVENQDTMNESFFAVKEDTEAFWQTDNSSESVAVIRGYADGSLEPLGAGEGAPMSGTFTLERGEKIYMATSQFVDSLKAQELFNKAGIDLALSSEDLSREIVEISFDNAISTVESDVSERPSSTTRVANINARAQRVRRKNEQKQKGEKPSHQDTQTDDAIATEAALAPVDARNIASNASPMDARARRVRERNEQKQKGEKPSHQDTRTDEAHSPVDARNIASNASAETSAIPKPLDGARDEMTDEERQYLEDERRGFKVTDKRKWSRVEMFGHEVGVHSDVSFTVPASKPATSKEAVTEVLNRITPGVAATTGNEVAESSKRKTPPSPNEAVPVAPKGSTVPFEVIDYNPNNDPAIEYGLARLDTLRAEMASLTANRQNRLFNLNGKKSRKTTKAYNDQLLALGRVVTADKQYDTALTDSQKNIAVMKFVVNEQAMLQAATKENLAGTKEGKLVDWMSIRGRAVDSTADVQKVMQAIEQATSSDAKIEFAQRHMSKLYAERTRSEKKERLQGATRVAALGVVGMAAMALGINPSMAGDAANNIFYSARKK